MKHLSSVLLGSAINWPFYPGPSFPFFINFVSLRNAIDRQKSRVPGSSSNKGFRRSQSFGPRYGIQIEQARPCCHRRAFGSMRQCKRTPLPSPRSEQYVWCPIQRRIAVFWTLSLLQMGGKRYLVAVQGSSRVWAMIWQQICVSGMCKRHPINVRK